MKANSALKVLLCGLGFLAGGAYTQNKVAFNSIPTNNACPYSPFTSALFNFNYQLSR